ncbi:hypothetical protein L7F22_063388 [Adiantum nelumboides]|nr:hypothetical protein [Adiantum nelumboides]
MMPMKRAALEVQMRTVDRGKSASMREHIDILQALQQVILQARKTISSEEAMVLMCHLPSRWAQGMDRSSLDTGLVVTARSPGIWTSFGYLAGSAVVLNNVDHTTTLKMVLSPSLVKESLQFFSPPSIPWGSSANGFLHWSPWPVIYCGGKGHVAA